MLDAHLSEGSVASLCDPTQDIQGFESPVARSTADGLPDWELRL